MLTEKGSKIALSANDNKIIQTPDGGTTYSLGYVLEKYAIENWLEIQNWKIK